MDETIESFLLVLRSIVRNHGEFLDNENIRLINYSSRSVILTRYLNNETHMLEMLHRLYTQHLLSNAANALLSLSIPTTTRFLEPVIVSPTTTQVNNSLQTIESSDSPCAICQETISSNGVRLRSCRHDFHRSCISQWFSMSVRCPVCRHDIREEGQANQTSAVSRQTSSQ